MTQLNDCILKETYYSSVPTQYNDSLLAYYLRKSATTRSMKDAEREFLLAKGVAPASINGMWFAYLRSLGFTGALPDMKLKAWCQGFVDIDPAVLIEYLYTMHTEGLAKYLLLMGNNKTATFATTMNLNNGDFSTTVIFSTLGNLTLPGIGSQTLISSHIGFSFRIYVSNITGTVSGEVGSGSGTFQVQTESSTIVTTGDRYEVTFSYVSATDTYSLSVDGVEEDSVVNTGTYTPSVSFVGSNAVGSSDFQGIMYSLTADNSVETRTWHMTSKNSDYEPAEEDPFDTDLNLIYNNITDDDWYVIDEIVLHNNEILYHNAEITIHTL